MPVPGFAPRELLVGGLANVRDLGGLRTPDGRQVRRGRLIRSDNLGFLTYEGVDLLLQRVGVRFVVDLRTAEECEREGIGPLSGHGVAYRNIPLVPQSAITEEEVAAGLATNLLDDYLAHLRVSGAALIAGFELLAEDGHLPAVVHCTAGKDRTGLFIALLLDVLGVARDEIVADYAATAANMPTILDRVRTSPFFQANGLAAAPAWIFGAEPQTMRSFLAAVDERYGGAEKWALEQGASPEAIERLRTLLLSG